MSSKTVTAEVQLLQNVLIRLDKLTKDIETIKEKLFEMEPEYGSDAWWEWSDKKGMEDYKKGDYFELRDEADVKDFFKHIDDEQYVYNTFHAKSKKTAK